MKSVQAGMAPDFSRGLRFTFKEGIQAEVDRLRGVDLILGGHTHERTYQPVREGGTPVIQSGSEGSFLGRVTFRVRWVLPAFGVPT